MQMERESGKPDPPPVPRSRNGGGPRLKLLRASASLRLGTRGNAACVSRTALLSCPLASGVALLQYIYHPRQRLGNPFLGHHLLSWNEIVSLSRWGIVGEEMRVWCEERFPVQGQ